MRLISVLLLLLAVVLCICLGIDIVMAATGPSGVHDGDWIVLTGAVAFLALAVFRRQWAQTLATAALLAVAGLMLVEVGLSAAGPQTQRPFAWYLWAPGAPVAAVAEAGDDHPCANSCGLRGPELMPDDQYRILCVGGSTTECSHLADARSWPRLLAEQLHGLGQHVWVGNAGRGDLTSTDHITLLENLPEAADVDCWIVLCGMNDLQAHLRGECTTTSEQSWAKTFQYRRPGGTGPLQRPLYRNLHMVTYLEQGLQHVCQMALEHHNVEDLATLDSHEEVADDDPSHEQWPLPETLDEWEPLLVEYQQNLERLVQLARQRGKRLMLLTQPLCTATADHSDLSRQMQGLVEAYNERMRLVCRQQRVELVDLATLLPDSSEVFSDEFHFSDLGSVQVAQTLSSSFTMLGVAAHRREGITDVSGLRR